MENDFGIETTREGIQLTRKNVTGLKINCIEGLCAANRNEISIPRDRKWYNENILVPMIARKEIDDGSRTPFDDRKMWLDYTSISPGVITMALGFTNYKDFKRDLNSSSEELIALQRKGEGLLRNKFAFLSTRAPGICGLVISAEGSIFIGQRAGTVDCPGSFNAVSGHVTYNADSKKIDLENEVARECLEEIGIGEDQIERMTFVGGYNHPVRGDLDFSFLVHTSLPNSYFTSGDWAKKVKEKEHSNLIQISSYASVQDLLQNGILPGHKDPKIFYSTRGALQSVRPSEMAS